MSNRVLSKVDNRMGGVTIEGQPGVVEAGEQRPFRRLDNGLRLFTSPDESPMCAAGLKFYCQSRHRTTHLWVGSHGAARPSQAVRSVNSRLRITRDSVQQLPTGFVCLKAVDKNRAGGGQPIRWRVSAADLQCPGENTRG